MFPDPAGTPRHSLLMGDSVPIWFVSKHDYEAVIADGVLTVDELRSLPSLRIGIADFYLEVLQPLDGPASVPKLKLFANGTLSDGGTFDVVFIEGARGVSRLDVSID